MNEYNFLQSGMGKKKVPKKQAPVERSPAVVEQEPFVEPPTQEAIEALAPANDTITNNYRRAIASADDTPEPTTAIGSFARSFVNSTALNLIDISKEGDKEHSIAQFAGQLTPWLLPGGNIVKGGAKLLTKSLGWVGKAVVGAKAVNAVGKVGQTLGKSKTLQQFSQGAGKSYESFRKWAPTTQVLKLGDKVGKGVTNFAKAKKVPNYFAGAAGAAAGTGTVLGVQSGAPNLRQAVTGDKSIKKALKDTGFWTAAGAGLGVTGNNISKILKLAGKWGAKGGTELSKYYQLRNIQLSTGTVGKSTQWLDNASQKLKVAFDDIKMTKSEIKSFLDDMPKKPNTPKLEGSTLAEINNLATGDQKQYTLWELYRRNLEKSGITKDKLKGLHQSDTIKIFKDNMNKFNNEADKILTNVTKNHKPTAISESAMSVQDFKKILPKHEFIKNLGSQDLQKISPTKQAKIDGMKGQMGLFDKNKKQKDIMTAIFNKINNEQVNITKINYKDNPYLINIDEMTKIYKDTIPSKVISHLSPKAKTDFKRLRNSFYELFINSTKKKITIKQPNIVELKKWLTTAEGIHKTGEYVHIQDNLKDFFNSTRKLIQTKITESNVSAGNYSLASKNFHINKSIYDSLSNPTYGMTASSYAAKSSGSALGGVKVGLVSQGLTALVNRNTKGWSHQAKQSVKAKKAYETFGKSGLKKTPYLEDQWLHNSFNFAGNRAKGAIKKSKLLYPGITSHLMNEADK